LNYIASNYVHLDHDQTFTGSAGAAYSFHEVKYSSDLIFGSGLRSGFANTDHLPFYTQVNAGVEHSVDLGAAGPASAKFSVINLFDNAYEIRDGSGIGVFAPQYGPRRTFLVTASKSF
jgi:outer membrane receptor protein involved in Fe transport